MYKLNINTVLSPKIINKIISDFRSNDLLKFNKLHDYYIGKHAILDRTMTDPTKPNNKSIFPYPNYITDIFTGYFMGEAINYSGLDIAAVEQLKMIFIYNDAADNDSELAKDASIFGKAYEMLYIDADGAVRFKKIDAREIILINDDTVESEILYAIRHFTVADIETDLVSSLVEVYTKDSILTYKGDENFGDLTLIEEQTHYFGIVPFVMYKNNDDCIGDFELVISLIDAYDKLNSDNLNDFEYFVDAYLGLYGVDLDSEDVVSMKENRVLLLPTDAKAEWLTKNVSDTQVENLKSRYSEDIHKFSKCPALTDENFASNASGVAMKYKVMGMENVAATKERKFKKGLQRRIEAIANILSLKGEAVIDWRGIEITFKRSLPSDSAEIADTVNKLRGLISDGTLLDQIPFIEDSQAELDKVAVQNESKYTLNSTLDITVDEEENADGTE